MDKHIIVGVHIVDREAHAPMVQEIFTKYGAQINVAEINAIMERDRENMRQSAKDQAQGLFTGNVPPQNF